MSSFQRVATKWLLAKGRAKKDVGHGGLDEWFSGHGSGKSKSKGKARWGGWVAITPVKRTITKPDGSKKTYEPGDIVGPCGISNTKEWKEFTKGGQDPLKCMPRQKAYDMPKKERAEVAKGKLKAERKEKETKAPTRTRTFKDKKAAVGGTVTGDGESPGLFLRLPDRLAKKFPRLEEDPSPSHVTFQILGEAKSKGAQEALLKALGKALEKWPSRIKATLGPLQYFDHAEDNQRVAYVSVAFDKDLSELRQDLQKDLKDAGIQYDDKWPEFRPHVTLGYLEGLGSKWNQKVPKGSWVVTSVELWGLPKLHTFDLSLTGRVAHRYLSGKIFSKGPVR